MPERAVAISTSADMTQRLAASLAAFLRPGSALCLEGDLGAGKTTFVRGLVSALGGAEAVVSPTFTLENRYPLPDDGQPIAEVVHADLYRTPDRFDEDLLPSMLEAREGGALIAVEWADALETHLAPLLRIAFRLLPTPAGVDPAGPSVASPPREVTLTPVPAGWKPLDRLRNAWKEVERGDA
jgi:tRNA threonylcarbamoyladenosine biosynthesis protein TsaE